MKDTERGEKGSEARWKVLLHGAHHCTRGNNHCYETNFQFFNASGETSSIYPASTDVWRLEDFFVWLMMISRLEATKQNSVVDTVVIISYLCSRFLDLLG